MALRIEADLQGRLFFEPNFRCNNMRVHIQRVKRAAVVIESQTVAQIDQGLLLLIGFGQQDTAQGLQRTAQRIVNLRLFADEQGRFAHSAVDVAADLLAVPQFTLYARLDKGRRPDFGQAKSPQSAALLFAEFAQVLAAQSPGKVEQGQFGADMQVELINDGPVTVLLQTDNEGNIHSP